MNPNSTQAPNAPLNDSEYAIELRPTLVLGLGGSGTRIALELKARLEEELGPDSNYQDIIKILCLDTAKEARTTTQPNNPHKVVEISQETEMLRISSVPLRQLIMNRGENPAIDDILPESLESTHVDQGAQQVRRIGRISLMYHYETVLERLRQAVGALRALGADRRQRFAADGRPIRRVDSQRLRVFLLSSICGGTGGGTFIDMAYMARFIGTREGIEDARSVEVVGMLLLPEVFPEVSSSGGERIRANAYASLLDLEYYNQITANEQTLYKVRFSEKRSLEVEGPPFTVAYLVTGKSKTGGITQGMADLSPLLADSLHLMITSRVGQQLDATLDNVKAQLATYYKGYRAFYSALGVANLIYPRRWLQVRYGLMLMEQVLDNYILRPVGNDRRPIQEQVSRWLEGAAEAIRLQAGDLDTVIQPLTMLRRQANSVSDPQDSLMDAWRRAWGRFQNDYERPLLENTDAITQQLANSLTAEVQTIVDRGLTQTVEVLRQGGGTAYNVDDVYQQVLQLFKQDITYDLNQNLRSIAMTLHRDVNDTVHDLIEKLEGDDDLSVTRPEAEDPAEEILMRINLGFERYMNAHLADVQEGLDELLRERLQQHVERVLRQTRQGDISTADAAANASANGSGRYTNQGGLNWALAFLDELQLDLNEQLEDIAYNMRRFDPDAALNSRLNQIGRGRQARRVSAAANELAMRELRGNARQDVEGRIKQEVFAQLLLEVQSLRARIEAAIAFWQVQRQKAVREGDAADQQASSAHYTTTTHSVLENHELRTEVERAISTTMSPERRPALLLGVISKAGQLSQTLDPDQQPAYVQRFRRYAEGLFEDNLSSDNSVVDALRKHSTRGKNQVGALERDANPLLSYSTGKIQAIRPAVIKVMGSKNPAVDRSFLVRNGLQETEDLSFVETGDPTRLSYLVTHHGLPLFALNTIGEYRTSYEHAVIGERNVILHMSEELESEPHDPGSDYYINQRDFEADVARALAYDWVTRLDHVTTSENRVIYALRPDFYRAFEQALKQEVDTLRDEMQMLRHQHDASNDRHEKRRLTTQISAVNRTYRELSHRSQFRDIRGRTLAEDDHKALRYPVIVAQRPSSRRQRQQDESQLRLRYVMTLGQLVDTLHGNGLRLFGRIFRAAFNNFLTEYAGSAGNDDLIERVRVFVDARLKHAQFWSAADQRRERAIEQHLTDMLNQHLRMVERGRNIQQRKPDDYLDSEPQDTPPDDMHEALPDLPQDDLFTFDDDASDNHDNDADIDDPENGQS